MKWEISCQRWGRHYDHGLIYCILKFCIRAASRANPAQDFSAVKADAELRANFDNQIATSIQRGNTIQNNEIEIQYKTDDALKSLQETMSMV